MVRTRRKSLSPAIIKATHSGAFYFASKTNARWIRPRRSCARRWQNNVVDSVEIGGNRKCRITHSDELPIPRFPREPMPLQFERHRQSVDTFVEHFPTRHVAARSLYFG